ncbi:hypothetical protein OROGR_005510 [Orobanche gracilis]
MASSLAVKRVVSSASLLTRSLNPFLRQSAAALNGFDVDRRSNRPLHQRSDLFSSKGISDPFFWRRSLGQFSEYASVASGIDDGLNLGATGKDTNKKNVLRPLSPHLPIYKPQISSTTSILNRISGVYLSAYALAFYIVPMKLGSIYFSYGFFYQFLFHSSKLSLLSSEIAALALAYHACAGIRHLLMDVSGTVFPRK